MYSLCRLGVVAGMLLVAGGEYCAAQTQPAATVPAVARAVADTQGTGQAAEGGAATEAAATQAHTVDELLPSKAVPFDFAGRPVLEVMDYIAKSYGVRIVNNYADKLDQTITLKTERPLTARQAIDKLNATMVALGYTVLDSVKGDQVILTIVPTKVDETARVPVFYGNDPAKIPEGEELRTQVFVLKNLDPASVKETVSAVLGKRADVTVNSSTRTMIITDTGSHVHTAAALLEVLDKQAGDKAK